MTKALLGICSLLTLFGVALFGVAAPLIGSSKIGGPVAITDSIPELSESLSGLVIFRMQPLKGWRQALNGRVFFMNPFDSVDIKVEMARQDLMFGRQILFASSSRAQTLTCEPGYVVCEWKIALDQINLIESQEVVAVYDPFSPSIRRLIGHSGGVANEVDGQVVQIRSVFGGSAFIGKGELEGRGSCFSKAVQGRIDASGDGLLICNSSDNEIWIRWIDQRLIGPYRCAPRRECLIPGTFHSGIHAVILSTRPQPCVWGRGLDDSARFF